MVKPSQNGEPPSCLGWIPVLQDNGAARGLVSVPQVWPPVCYSVWIRQGEAVGPLENGLIKWSLLAWHATSSNTLSLSFSLSYFSVFCHFCVCHPSQTSRCHSVKKWWSDGRKFECRQGQRKNIFIYFFFFQAFNNFKKLEISFLLFLFKSLRKVQQIKGHDSYEKH